MGTTNVLFEVGLEEMPARFIAETEKQLKERTVTWLEENRLTYQSLKTYITPRRFAIQIIDLIDKQTDLETEVRGPAKKIALDDNGDWSKAAIGFTKGQGVSVDDIYYQEVKGTEYIFVKKFTAGKAASEILPSFKDVILAMTFPKNMRWSNRRLRYIRPIKWIVAIENKGQIDFEIEGIQTSNKSKGHRFLGGDLVITDPLDYEKLLLDQYVIADRKKRQAEILTQLNQLATEKEWHIDIEADLLDEVTELVEYPTVFAGSYSDDYLIIPEEALITSMKVHQRYFPVRNQDGGLLPFFIGVRNGNAKYIDNVVKGNEKVLNARLADGLFFYQEDQKQTIEQNNQKLEKIVFQQQLGTVADKVNRVRENARTIAKKLNLTEQEINQVDRAVTISKFDLVTQMVDEFPELQGIMGQKYADLFGEDDLVAKAINEQYMPRHAKDQLPETVIGAILSVADKLDTIVGCIGVGLIPTGSQDPYGLRRQAMGIIQILEQKKWPVSFEILIDTALNQFNDSIISLDQQADVREKTLDFIEGRISFLVKEESVAHDVIKAVTHKEIGVISHLLSKAKLLEAKRQDPSFKSAQEALGRVVNLAEIDETHHVDPTLFENESERELFTAYQEIEADYSTKMNQGQYQEALQLLEQIAPTINQFFDQTMVMVDNPSIKNNRIGLLNLIAKLIYQLANFKDIEWKQHF
ncbi:MAG TPA: glycine--tRNA ligase subunit beta [Bacilli bacterium]|mgnify:FL=1|nr:glycine--tRNA ligase subunit beta [Bacilli bacterium]